MLKHFMCRSRLPEGTGALSGESMCPIQYPVVYYILLAVVRQVRSR